MNDDYAQYPQPDELRLFRQLPGPVERIWAFLTEPDKRRTWFTDGPLPRVEGARGELLFRHANISPDETPPEEARAYHDPGTTMATTVTRCVPPHVLGFTWGGVDPQQASEVLFELTPSGEHVQLVLTHRGVSDRNELADVSAGWHTHLAILGARLRGTTPPPIWATSAKLQQEYARRLAAAGPPAANP